MLSHFLDTRQDALPALPQIVTDQIYGLHDLPCVSGGDSDGQQLFRTRQACHGCRRSCAAVNANSCRPARCIFTPAELPFREITDQCSCILVNSRKLPLVFLIPFLVLVRSLRNCWDIARSPQRHRRTLPELSRVADRSDFCVSRDEAFSNAPNVVTQALTDDVEIDVESQCPRHGSSLGGSFPLAALRQSGERRHVEGLYELH